MGPQVSAPSPNKGGRSPPQNSRCYEILKRRFLRVENEVREYFNFVVWLPGWWRMNIVSLLMGPQVSAQSLNKGGPSPPQNSHRYEILKRRFLRVENEVRYYRVVKHDTDLGFVNVMMTSSAGLGAELHQSGSPG